MRIASSLVVYSFKYADWENYLEGHMTTCVSWSTSTRISTRTYLTEATDDSVVP